ncbi:metallophosphoesterase [Spirochaeta cellobiosiphila]|uniref:metallophosphoesterase n=1 Tax=Spirochaeta cellobiosiphila TaxID=504483 RepID=UPI00042A680A|nr:metallophosphoesterase [Spirochaeta cellobiosiphila]
MKILVVADHIDPLVYSNSIKKRFEDVDLILGAGDLPLEYYGFIVSSLNKPCYFVFGNHHLKRFNFYKKKSSEMDPRAWMDTVQYEHHFGATYVGGKVIRTPKNLLMAGLGGSIRYNGDDNQYTDLGMYLNCFKLIPKLIYNKIKYGRYLDILLTHSPPKGIHDKPDPCHIGFKAFLWFMRVFKPKYLIHGHIHLYELNAKRQSRYYETIIINAYDHIVIDLEVPNE